MELWPSGDGGAKQDVLLLLFVVPWKPGPMEARYACMIALSHLLLPLLYVLIERETPIKKSYMYTSYQGSIEKCRLTQNI